MNQRQKAKAQPLPKPQSSQEFLFLLGIGVFALALRCLLLGKEGFWFDELMSWWFSSDFRRAAIAEGTNPPVYYLALYAWTHLFGTSEVAFRSLSVLASMGALVTTYQIARKLFSVRIAQITLVYQAICAFQIFYAQEARTHALLLLLTTTAFLVLLKGVEEFDEQRKFRFLALYAVLAAIGMYMHFVSTFYFAAHGLYILLRYRNKPSVILAYATSGVLACLLFAPWLLRMLQTAASGEGQTRRYLWLKLPQAYFSLLFGDSLVPLDEQAVRNLGTILREYAPVLGLALFSAAVIFNYVVKGLRRSRFESSSAVVLLSIVPPLIALLISVIQFPMIDERYLLSSSPFLYMGVAVGLNEMLSDFRRRSTLANGLAALAVTVFAGLLLLSLWNYYFTPRFGKDQWREAVRFIETSVPDQKALVVYDPDFLEAAQGYYQRRSVPHLRITPKLKSEMMASTDAAQQSLNGYDSVWLVRSLNRDDFTLNLFRRLFVQKQHMYYPKGNGIDIYQFERRP